MLWEEPGSWAVATYYLGQYFYISITVMTSDHLRFSAGTPSGLSGSNPDHSPGRVPGVSWVSSSVDKDGIPQAALGAQS